MKIRHEGTQRVSYQEWSDRLAGFMFRPERIISSNLPENKHTYPRIDVDINSVIDGFNAKVRYYQVIDPNKDLTEADKDVLLAEMLVAANSGIEDLNFVLPNEIPIELNTLDQMVLPIQPIKHRLIFSYDYTADLEATQAMLTAASAHPLAANLTGLNLTRTLMQILTQADILENNVFDLTANQWEQKVM